MNEVSVIGGDRLQLPVENILLNLNRPAQTGQKRQLKKPTVFIKRVNQPRNSIRSGSIPDTGVDSTVFQRNSKMAVVSKQIGQRSKRLQE